MEVRTFTEADRGQMSDLFVRAGEGSPNSNFWGHPESEAAIYLDPYMDREPESLFVADDDGALVGYLAGCVDSAAFPSEDERFTAAIKDHRLFLKPRPAAFLARAGVDIVGARLRRKPVAEDFADPRWPAHLHIDLVPEARGTGAADELMHRWLDRLRQSDVAGCHLGTLVENERAVRFFRRMGFEPYGPTPLVPGLRHRGRRLHQLTMVWSNGESHHGTNIGP